MSPTLTTERLTLRGMTVEDVPAVLDLYSRVEVQRWIGDGRVMTGLDEARALVVAVTHTDNAPSQRVARRLGMTDRGTSDRYYDTTTHLFELTL